MKKLSKILFKGFVFASLFTATTIILSTSGVPAVSEAHADATYTQVDSYLCAHGYTVMTLQPITWYKTSDWIATTVKNSVNYQTTVHVSGSNIIGHDDVIM